MTKTLTPEELRKLTKQELIARKRALATEIRKQAEAYDERRKDNGEAWPDETSQAWESVNKEYDANEAALIDVSNDDEIRSRVEAIKKAEEASQRDGKPKPGLDDQIPGEDRTYGDRFDNEDRAQQYAQRQRDKQLVFRSWIVAPLAEENPKLLTDEMRDACQRCNFRPTQGQVRANLLDTRSHRILQRSFQQMNHRERALAVESGEVRALSTGTAGAGPELIPQTFVNILEMALLANGEFLQFVDTLTTETGDKMHWPIVDDTSNEGHWVAVEGEDTQTIGEPNPTFARPTWDAHELHSKWIKVPIALNDDSMFDLEMVLAQLIGQRLGRTINTAATTGDGSGKPHGLLTAGEAVLGVTAAAAAAIAYDDIVKLEHSVDPAYRNESAFMLHDTVLQTIRLLKDSDGRPLWQVSMRDGTPDRLHNRPYAINQAMSATVTADDITMAFGRLRDYKLRRVRGIRIIRAVERFVEKLQIGFLGYTRVDGRLLRPTADDQVSVKWLQQAAA